MSKEFLTPKKIITGSDSIENSIKYLVAMGQKNAHCNGENCIRA